MSEPKDPAMIHGIRVCGCLLEEGDKHISGLTDSLTGEVYEQFDYRQTIGTVVFMGSVNHYDGATATDKNGESRVYCRVLGDASLTRMNSIQQRLKPSSKRIPLLLGHWYRVLYD